MPAVFVDDAQALSFELLPDPTNADVLAMPMPPSVPGGTDGQLEIAAPHAAHDLPAAPTPAQMAHLRHP